MRRIIAPLLLTLACGLTLLTAAGCRGTHSEQGGIGAGAGGVGDLDAGVDAFAPALSGFTDELLSKVESAPDPKTGVAEAQRLLDTRRDEMTARIAALKKSPLMRDAAAKRKWLEAEVDNTDRVHGLAGKYLDASMRDADFKARLDKLVSDYDAMFKDR
jgi:hypothetical protein